MLSTVVTHVIAFLLGTGVGAYGWYRFGSVLKTDAQKVTTAVKDLKS